MAESRRTSRLNVQAWHQRFCQQAAWTRSLRAFLYQTYHLASARRVLEVGCGTGAVTDDLHSFTTAQVVGIDLRLDFLKIASLLPHSTFRVNADGLALPFLDQMFDATLCHFLLLWIQSPASILSEMRRVTVPGGVVLALAEPDYGGRVDHPAELKRLGRLQTRSLKEQGANPFIGRELNQLFHQAGLINLHYGVLGGEWKEPLTSFDFQSEWKMIDDDLAGLISPDELADLRQAQIIATEQGSRTLFVPTFYAAGIVPPA